MLGYFSETNKENIDVINYKEKKYKTKKNKDSQGLPYQISVNLKGLSVIYLKKVRKEEIK